MMAHDVVLRGLGGGAGPLLIERHDRRFVPATLATCTTPNPLPALQAFAPERDTDPEVNGFRIHQPVHRSFALAMCEAACEQFGEPALDRDKIDSMGMVIRRVAKANPDKKKKNDGLPSRVRVLEAWVESQQTLRGWHPLTDPGDADLDPDPARRAQPFHAGQPVMKLILSQLKEAPPFVESTASLFVASPAVCAPSKRTILYGTVPVATSERAEASPQLAELADNTDREALVGALFANGQLLYLQANGGIWLASGIGGAQFARVDTNDALDQYVQFLRVLSIQLDVLGDSPESKALFKALDDQLVFFTTDERDSGSSAADHVKEAINVLVLGLNRDGSVPGLQDDGSIVQPSELPKVTLPLFWDSVSDAPAATLRSAVQAALLARASVVLGAEGRFEDPKALYQVRAFMRVKRDDGCPPELVWSRPSADFAIVPWFETGPVPPITITLPEVTLANIKKFKPNVAFKVPGALFNFLNSNKPKALIDGKGKNADGGGIDWICGFNIPIITICAFIILYIFLTLLDIVFWWMAYIKICIPIPRKL